MNYGNVSVSELAEQSGRIEWLSHLLQAEQVKYKVGVVGYRKALSLLGPEIVNQLYNLELQFPPGISFVGGLLDNSRLELIADFENSADLTNLALAVYEPNETSKKIYNNIMGKVPEQMAIVVGYANAAEVLEGRLRDIGFDYYINSVIIHKNYRDQNLGKKMVSPILEKFDRNSAASFLTTWCNNGERIEHNHYPPIEFWYRCGYRFVERETAEIMVTALREFQESHGVSGRSYNLDKRNIGYLRGKLGQHTLRGYDSQKKITVLNEYYEPTGFNSIRWDGVIMVRKGIK